MGGYDVEDVVLERQSKLRVNDGPTCVVTHRKIRAGDACVMLLTVPPLEGNLSAEQTNDGLWRRQYAAPPILGESDGAGWLTRAVRDEARDFTLFAIGGTDWETAKQVQQGAGLRIADGGFISWHSVAVPTHAVFVLRRAWYELLDSAVDVFPLQMKSVAAQAEAALRLLCKPTGRVRLSGKGAETISIADSSVVEKLLQDTACLDLHPNTRTALWWYAQLGRQAGCLSETSVEQLIARCVQQAIFQRALSWLV